jgi:hypothetical protein
VSLYLPHPIRAALRPLAAVVVAGGLAACGGGGDGDAAPDEAEPTTATATDEGGAAVETDEAGASTASTVEVPNRLPAARELDIQANHPNGASVVVRGVSFHDDRIQLDVDVTNGASFEIALSSVGRMILRDDLGNVYRLSPPSSNPRVVVPQEQSVEGTFVFLGRVAPGASSLTLTTNSNTSGDRSEYSRSPRFVVEPIPVSRDADADDEDGGADS